MIHLSNQADGLRAQTPRGGRVIPFRRRSYQGERRTIAVTSGKGGVGKTQVSANLAVGFARAGLSVLVLDADLGLASMDLAFGVRPEADLRDVLEGKQSMRDVLVEGPLGVKLVPACPGRYDMANLPPPERRRLLDAVSDVAAEFDVLLIDTGAGIGGNAVAFASHADEVVLVTTPDPTALRDAYAMAKVLHRRSGVDRVQLVANQVNSEVEGAELHENLDAIVRRFLTLKLDYLGAVPRDEAVNDAVRSGEPFLLASPRCPASRALEAITRRLLPQTAPRETC
ncbi:MAG: MinD/ParA family protein [Deltaproteobacteria bacterium]|nr:MinD/ParA family protein [Deltaproteobacteria bacterium]